MQEWHGNLHSLMPNNPGNKYITLKRKKLRLRDVKSFPQRYVEE